MLPHLNYDLIRANPKIFCGYSDIAVLHYALFTHANLRTFYGPATLTELGDYRQPLAFTAEHFLTMLTEEGLSSGKSLGTSQESCLTSPP